MGHKPFIQSRAVYRPNRFSQRIREELSSMLPGKLKDPRLEGIQFVTVTKVELTPDLKYADVSFSLMNDGERATDVEEALNQAANFLRKELMRVLNTKVTPHLVFRYDRGLDAANEMSSLLGKISGDHQ